MNNALSRVMHVIFGDTKFVTVLIQHFNLNAGDRVIYSARPIGCRHIVIGNG